MANRWSVNIEGLEIQASVFDVERSEDGDEEFGVVEIAEGVMVKVIRQICDDEWIAYAVDRENESQ